jgi:glycosyltransferase involved in cell wall biosynthesis
LQYEIVVVNDGSLDGTLANAMRYAKRNSHVKVVSYVKNMGKGWAAKTGFMQVTGEVVVFVDSDLEIDLSTISRYIAALQYGDIVIASKRHPDSHVEVPLSRKIMSHSFNAIVRLLTGVPLRIPNLDLKP